MSSFHEHVKPQLGRVGLGVGRVALEVVRGLRKVWCEDLGPLREWTAFSQRVVDPRPMRHVRRVVRVPHAFPRLEVLNAGRDGGARVDDDRTLQGAVVVDEVLRLLRFIRTVEAMNNAPKGRHGMTVDT